MGKLLVSHKVQTVVKLLVLGCTRTDIYGAQTDIYGTWTDIHATRTDTHTARMDTYDLMSDKYITIQMNNATMAHFLKFMSGYSLLLI